MPLALPTVSTPAPLTPRLCAHIFAFTRITQSFPATRCRHSRHLRSFNGADAQPGQRAGRRAVANGTGGRKRSITPVLKQSSFDARAELPRSHWHTQFLPLQPLFVRALQLHMVVRNCAPGHAPASCSNASSVRRFSWSRPTVTTACFLPFRQKLAAKSRAAGSPSISIRSQCSAWPT
jgi:hypothetical protein